MSQEGPKTRSKKDKLPDESSIKCEAFKIRVPIFGTPSITINSHLDKFKIKLD